MYIAYCLLPGAYCLLIVAYCLLPSIAYHEEGTVRSTVGGYSTYIQNINKILKNIEHRFVHQSGLDETSRQNRQLVGTGLCSASS